jgi:hypothetical protein
MRGFEKCGRLSAEGAEGAELHIDFAPSARREKPAQ